jgi:hypothetical protein
VFDEETVGNVLLTDSMFVGVQAFGLPRRMLRILHMRQENGLAGLTLRFSKVSKADHPTPHRRGCDSPDPCDDLKVWRSQYRAQTLAAEGRWGLKVFWSKGERNPNLISGILRGTSRE